MNTHALAHPAIPADRLAWYERVSLAEGAHDAPNGLACAMEAASYIAGEPWSDHPACVSPVIAAFMRAWNDGLPTNAERDRLLKPLVPLTLNTATGAEDDGRQENGTKGHECSQGEVSTPEYDDRLGWFQRDSLNAVPLVP